MARPAECARPGIVAGPLIVPLLSWQARQTHMPEASSSHPRPPPTAALSLTMGTPPGTRDGWDGGGAAAGPQGYMEAGDDDVILFPGSSGGGGGGLGGHSQQQTNQLIIRQQATQKGTYPAPMQKVPSPPPHTRR